MAPAFIHRTTTSGNCRKVKKSGELGWNVLCPMPSWMPVVNPSQIPPLCSTNLGGSKAWNTAEDLMRSSAGDADGEVQLVWASNDVGLACLSASSLMLWEVVAESDFDDA